MPKQIWEEEAKERFLAFLRQKRGEEWKALAEDVVVEADTNRNFDYQLGLGDRRIALEVFRLVDDGEELAQMRTWSEIVGALERELAKRDVKGYLLTTPPYFSVSRVKRNEFVKEVADRIETVIAANPGAEEIPFDGFSLKRIEGLDRIGCSGFGKGGAVNPPSIALSGLEEKLPNKNNQLAIPGHERILLVVNWSYLVDVEDFLEAASTVDFSRFPNVDKIFFEVAPGNCHQVFDRPLFVCFETGAFALNAELENLFVQWLKYRLARKDPRAFDIVKRLTTERGGVAWLPPMCRVEVVRYGTGFVTVGDWDNVKWILTNFRNDPDPTLQNDADDPDGKFNVHRDTERGESVRFILTVRGHLCWLLLTVVSANKTELYGDVLSIVEDFALGQNLYIRQQATLPLAELAKRRFNPPAGSGMQPAASHRVRALILRMVRENANSPPVLEGVASVLAYTPDLTPTEVEEALSILMEKPTHESPRAVSQLLVFYAFYRQRNETRFGAFDATRLKALLRQQLVNGFPAIRASILWRVPQILKDLPDETNTLLSYVSDFTSGAYDRNAFAQFYVIVAAEMKNHPDALGPALIAAFRCEREYYLSHEREMVWDFERKRLPALAHLYESGRIEDFLDCVDTTLDYKDRIFNFPVEALGTLVSQIESSRAQDQTRRLSLDS